MKSHALLLTFLTLTACSSLGLKPSPDHCEAPTPAEAAITKRVWMSK